MNSYNDLATRKLKLLKKGKLFLRCFCIELKPERGIKFIYHNLIAKWNWSKNRTLKFYFSQGT